MNDGRCVAMTGIPEEGPLSVTMPLSLALSLLMLCAEGDPRAFAAEVERWAANMRQMTNELEKRMKEGGDAE